MTAVKRFFSESSTVGKLMMLIGIILLIPLLVLPFYPDEAHLYWAFLLPGGISFCLGLLLCFVHKNRESDPSQWRYLMQRSSLIVLFAWCWGAVAGAIPFVLSCNMTVVQSLFESISGWTTTGLSVMDVSQTAHIFLFFRSFMQYCGGVGFVMVMVMMVQEKFSMNLYSAEGHPDKVLPNLKKTAQAICVLYVGLLAAGTIAYIIAGMNVFDAINHCMCALSTGGFSTKLNSIGEYNNLAIEIITIVLMLIGTTNFAVLILLFRGKIHQFLKVSEVRFMGLILIVLIPCLAFTLMGGMGMGVGEAFRHASFDLSSALSTTGYSTMGYGEWPPLAIGIMILVMLIGGGLGSTAGGLKMSRVYIMLRMAIDNIRRRVSPAREVRNIYYTRAQGKTQIDQKLLNDTAGFVVVYLSIFLLGGFLVTLTAGCGLTEGMFEFASALGTVGLSIGITGTTTGNATLIVEMIGMLLGRLEIFIVFIGMFSGFTLIKSRIFRRKRP